jgi:hypothetical protein
MIHLADQISVLDLTYMRHMYPYEHHMVVINGYVHNRAHPKGSMIEGYTTKEVIECCYRLHERWKPNRSSSFMTPWSTLWERNKMI